MKKPAARLKANTVSASDTFCEMHSRRRRPPRETRYIEPFLLIGGSGSRGRRLGSPRAPRTSTSSNRSEGATTAAGKPFCAVPKAAREVPATPAVWFCM